MKQFVARWVPPIAWAVLIFALSSIPQSHVPSLPEPVFEFIIKKTAHAFEYGVLSLLVLRALRRRHRHFLMAGMICFVYAISDEFHQLFVPGREATLRDVIIDGIAIVIFLLLSRLFILREERHPID